MKPCLLALSLLLSLLASAATPRRAVVVAGTSITFGYSFDATPYPERLATALGRPVANLGKGSDRIAGIRARWQLIAKPFRYKTLVLEGGTNDLAGVGGAATTGAVAWAAFEEMVEEARTAGQQVVIVAIPPRWGSSGWDADKEAERLAFNALAADYVADNPTVLLVDSDAVLGTGSPVALQVTYNYGDSLHLSASGQQALADGVAAVLSP